MKIRRATRADSPALARIQVDSYRSAYADIFPPAYLDRFSYEEQTRDWQDLLSTGNNWTLFVAESRQGDIVGYALGKAETDPQAEYNSSLTAIHVRRSLQRQGIGRRLLSAVVKELHEQGCTSLCLSTLAGNPVQAWYEQLGGVPIGEIRYTVDDVQMVEIKYGWSDMSLLLPCADQ